MNEKRKPACGGCGRFERGQPFGAGQCLACHAWFHKPGLEKLFGPHPFDGECPAGEAKARRVQLPCAHVGDDLTLTRAVDLGLSPRKAWHECGKGLPKNELKIPGVACACSGCGPKCEGYKSRE